ncbi:beta-2-glycoprotein 1-like isoform X1 [Xyrauchen texanus]|uniref:beta-2-glycoprotein 1-like isoform X1 n=1 Tax=Xyrauchen texanus TaxID=154827 RepID=UPI002241C6BC|nr:beta-2-glycoprotein 1-like isoform X1 [Xyrauchen texanus]
MRLTLSLLLFCHVCHETVDASTVCSRPPAVDGSEVLGGQRVFEPGELATLKCSEGYTPISGSRKIICTITGEWTERSLQCSPKRCPTPDPPANGNVVVSSIVFQSTINYTCNEGYELHGNSSSECLHTATWSSPAPQCKSVTCGLPVIPKYAKIIYDKVVTSNSTEFGLGITYKCLPPLALFGNERGYCTPNRTWTDPPECREVSCQVPAAVENGFMTSAVRREYLFMDRVRYGCYKGYVLDGPMEIVCEKSGHWSNEPICKEEAK